MRGNSIFISSSTSRKSLIWILILAGEIFTAGRIKAQTLSLTNLPSAKQSKSDNPFLADQNSNGSIIYAQDNARYTTAGFSWPWDNVLALRGKAINVTKNVGVDPYNFVFKPRWSMDKIGFDSSNSGRFLMLDTIHTINPGRMVT